MSIDANAAIAAALLSVLPPLVFIGIRQAVKINRREVVRDLAAVFSLPATRDEDLVALPASPDKPAAPPHAPHEESLIPSFEFVKYKYFFQRLGKTDGDQPQDHSILSWSIGSIPLIILLFVLSYIVATTILSVVIGEIGSDGGPPGSSIPGVDPGRRPLWIWCLCAAFAGGYVFMIRSFYRAINNFDFSPLSLVGACNNLFIGFVGAMILPVVVLDPVTTSVADLHAPATIVAVVLSFAIGYLPDSATRTLLWRSDLVNFKRENQSVYKTSLTTPLEIIDGIDTETRDRLADFHIRSTQNLATANPLMLFVETPYGVYQIMDWVAQAQLCCSVGPAALTKLWALGIRTLFDLERLALDADCYDKALLAKIGAILMPADSAGQFCDAEDTVVSNIVVRLDDPHVQRLRQIYIRIGNRLGSNSRRFKHKTDRSGRPGKPAPQLQPLKPGNTMPAAGGISP